ncbi:MAG TPA: VanZ family protein [Gemmatimonadales bacterium]|nr:VanZ family protein [Gemmatimonadales bacterium]
MTADSREIGAPYPRAGLALAVLGAIFIAALTLTPAPEEADRVAELSWTCLVCGDLGGTDVSLNLLLFAPFAAGLALLGWRTWRVCLVAALVSLSIETIQFAYLPGRDASLSDFITNTTGATLAAFVVNHRGVWLTPTVRQARTLLWSGLVAWVAMEGITAWAVQPALPHTRYWGQWAADLGFLDRFTGRVLSATVSGDSLPPHRVMDSERLRRQLLAGGSVATLAITGSAPDGLAPIASIFDQGHQMIAMLGQRRAETYFRVRTHVDDLRFRPPAIILSDALPAGAGTLIRLEGSYERGVYRLRVEANGHALERDLAASPSWGWSFFMPYANYALGRSVYALTALWIAGLLLPLGFWARRAHGWWPLLSLGVAVTATLVMVPLLAGLRPVHPTEWGAAALGLSAGCLLGGWSVLHG